MADERYGTDTGGIPLPPSAAMDAPPVAAPPATGINTGRALWGDYASIYRNGRANAESDEEILHQMWEVAKDRGDQDFLEGAGAFHIQHPKEINDAHAASRTLTGWVLPKLSETGHLDAGGQPVPRFDVRDTDAASLLREGVIAGVGALAGGSLGRIGTKVIGEAGGALLGRLPAPVLAAGTNLAKTAARTFPRAAAAAPVIAEEIAARGPDIAAGARMGGTSAAVRPMVENRELPSPVDVAVGAATGAAPGLGRVGLLNLAAKFPFLAKLIESNPGVAGALAGGTSGVAVAKLAGAETPKEIQDLLPADGVGGLVGRNLVPALSGMVEGITGAAATRNPVASPKASPELVQSALKTLKISPEMTKIVDTFPTDGAPEAQRTWLMGLRDATKGVPGMEAVQNVSDLLYNLLDIGKKPFANPTGNSSDAPPVRERVANQANLSAQSAAVEATPNLAAPDPAAIEGLLSGVNQARTQMGEETAGQIRGQVPPDAPTGSSLIKDLKSQNKAVIDQRHSEASAAFQQVTPQIEALEQAGGKVAFSPDESKEVATKLSELSGRFRPILQDQTSPVTKYYNQLLEMLHSSASGEAPMNPGTALRSIQDLRGTYRSLPPKTPAKAAAGALIDIYDKALDSIAQRNPQAFGPVKEQYDAARGMWREYKKADNLFDEHMADLDPLVGGRHYLNNEPGAPGEVNKVQMGIDKVNAATGVIPHPEPLKQAARANTLLGGTTPADLSGLETKVANLSGLDPAVRQRTIDILRGHQRVTPKSAQSIVDEVLPNVSGKSDPDRVDAINRGAEVLSAVASRMAPDQVSTLHRSIARKLLSQNTVEMTLPGNQRISTPDLDKTVDSLSQYKALEGTEVGQMIKALRSGQAGVLLAGDRTAPNQQSHIIKAKAFTALAQELHDAGSLGEWLAPSFGSDPAAFISRIEPIQRVLRENMNPRELVALRQDVSAATYNALGADPKNHNQWSPDTFLRNWSTLPYQAKRTLMTQPMFDRANSLAVVMQHYADPLAIAARTSPDPAIAAARREGSVTSFGSKIAGELSGAHVPILIAHLPYNTFTKWLYGAQLGSKEAAPAIQAMASWLKIPVDVLQGELKSAEGQQEEQKRFDASQK